MKLRLAMKIAKGASSLYRKPHKWTEARAKLHGKDYGPTKGTFYLPEKPKA